MREADGAELSEGAWGIGFSRTCAKGKTVLRIAILHPAFMSVGGAEILALSQAKCLQALGHDVQIVTSAVDLQRWGDDLRPFKVDLLGARDRFDALGGRELFIARRVRRLPAILSGLDVAIAHNYPMSRILAHASSRVRKIWYCNEPYREIHLEAAHPTLAARREAGLPPNSMAELRFHRQRASQQWWSLNLARKFVGEGRRDLATIEKIDLLCANSGYARELALRTYGSRPCKVLYPVVRFPADVAHRHGLNRSELRILVHTRLVPEKNVDTVLRGFAMFASASSTRGLLDIVGEGPSREPLEKLARELGIAPLVHFHGFVSQSELTRIYEACEVFTLLPIDEPFGMVFPEAAARGLLMVGPDHGGPWEILDEGKLGFVADPFSAESLSEVYRRIASMSDDEVDRKREAADASCRARFSESTIMSQMNSVYELEG